MKLNLKRIITFVILLIFLAGAYLIKIPVLKILFLGISILIISFIIFSKNGDKSYQLKDETEDDSVEEEDNTTEKNTENSIPENRILTDYDIQEKTKISKITQFSPRDLNEQYKKIVLEPIPNSASIEGQFNFILEKILDVIKHVFLAHSAIFFWYRKDRNQIIFHNISSDEKNLQRIKYVLGSDIISKVIISGNPNYTCNINSNVEADLIKYYNTTIGIRSIAAVPVYLNEKLIGVLAIDSKSEDAFGPETIYTLGKFVRMITLVLSMYDEKFNIELVNQKLDAILELIGGSNRELSEKRLIQNFIVVLDKFIDWDVLGIVLYDTNAKNYSLKKIVNRTSIDYLGEGLPVDISSDTLIGTSVRNGNSIRLDDSGINKYSIFRKNEPSAIKGSLMIIPISSNGKIHGAFVFESLKKKIYTDDDVRLIEKVASYFASQLDYLLNKMLLDKYLNIDIETMLLNRQTFERRVQEELTKFKSTDMHIGLALISVDRVDKLLKKFSQKVIPKIAKHISFQLLKETEDLMFVGRLENLKFGVLFLNRDSASDNVWCQKILQKISGGSIYYEEQEIGITVSIGYAGGVKIIKAETLFNLAETALNKAILDGGNKIRTTK